VSSAGGYQYDVLARQRILALVPPEKSTSAPLTLVQNLDGGAEEIAIEEHWLGRI